MLRLGLFVGLVGALVVPFAAGLEEVGLDLLFRLRGPRRVPPEVLVVTVDKASAQALGLEPAPSAWPRSLHARLVEGLVRRGASLIVYDLFFRTPRSAADDRRFARAINDAGRVVLCCTLEADVLPVDGSGGRPASNLTVESVVHPLPLFADSAVAVAPWPLPKAPAKVTRFWAFKTSAGGSPTLPVVAFQVYALEAYPELVALMAECGGCPPGTFGSEASEILKNGGVQELVAGIREVFQEAPLLRKGARDELDRSTRGGLGERKGRLLRSLVDLYRGEEVLLLDYYGPPKTVPTVGFATALEALEAPPGQRSLDFRGKVVFVGLSELFWARQKDGFHSPFSLADGLELSGVEIAATAFANLLENRPVRAPGVPAHLGAVFLWGVLLGAVALFLPTGAGAAALTGLGAGWAGVAVGAFRAQALWLPLAVPLLVQVPLAFLGALLVKYAGARKAREEIAEAAKQYLPAWVVDELADVGPGIELEGQLIHAVCLMTDAKQYASVAERKEGEGGPDELRRWLNRYFEAVFRPILGRGGHVVDIAGDSMLGLWRCDPADPGVREQACCAALELDRAVSEFNRAAGEHALPTRIGLDLGEVSLGSVGAVGRFAYRATGNVVNTAARLEGLNKYLGTRVLASRGAVDGLTALFVRSLGEFQLAGLSRAVEVVELRGLLEEAPPDERRLCEEFEQGIGAFRSGAWAEAERVFRRFRGDGPSQFYLRLCERYRTNGPPESWDGVVRLEQK